MNFCKKSGVLILCRCQLLQLRRDSKLYQEPKDVFWEKRLQGSLPLSAGSREVIFYYSIEKNPISKRVKGKIAMTTTTTTAKNGRHRQQQQMPKIDIDNNYKCQKWTTSTTTTTNARNGRHRQQQQMPKMDNHRGSPNLTMLNVLNVLNMLNVHKIPKDPSLLGLVY